MRRSYWLVALALGLGCSAPTGKPVAPPLELARLLPPAGRLAGWTVAEGPLECSPDALYEYLDGGAERYLGYGFRRLVHVRYQEQVESGAAVTVDLFDMGSELGAFGIFASGRPPAAARKEWGVAGYRSGAVAAAWKGALFVHAESDDERPELIAMLERLVAQAVAQAPGESSPPAFVARFPPAGLVAESERYVASDLLGHEFLPGGFLATYELDGGKGELFWSDLGRPASADAALARLRGHHARSGVVSDRPTRAGSSGFSFTDSSLGSGTVVALGRFVAGVHGELSDATRERLLDDLAARLAEAPSSR